MAEGVLQALPEPRALRNGVQSRKRIISRITEGVVRFVRAFRPDTTRAEISVEGAPKQDEGIVIDSGMFTRLQGAYQRTLESIHRQGPDKQNGSHKNN
jgi:hypothetical protein